MRLAATLLLACLVSARPGVAADLFPPGAVAEIASADAAGLWARIQRAALAVGTPPETVTDTPRAAAFAALGRLASTLATEADGLAAAAFFDGRGRLSVVLAFRYAAMPAALERLAAWETGVLLANPGVEGERAGAVTVWRLPGDAVAAARVAGDWLIIANDAALAVRTNGDGEPLAGGYVEAGEIVAALAVVPGAIPAALQRQYVGAGRVALDDERVGAVVRAAADFPARFAAEMASARQRSARTLRDVWLAAQLAYERDGRYPAGIAATPGEAASAWFTRGGVRQGYEVVNVGPEDAPDAVLVRETAVWLDNVRLAARRDGMVFEQAEAKRR